MTRLEHNGKPGHANTSLCSPKQIQIMRQAGFCLFIGNITVKLLLVLARSARGYSHHRHTYKYSHRYSHLKTTTNAHKHEQTHTDAHNTTTSTGKLDALKLPNVFESYGIETGIMAIIYKVRPLSCK